MGSRRPRWLALERRALPGARAYHDVGCALVGRRRLISVAGDPTDDLVARDHDTACSVDDADATHDQVRRTSGSAELDRPGRPGEVDATDDPGAADPHRGGRGRA